MEDGRYTTIPFTTGRESVTATSVVASTPSTVSTTTFGPNASPTEHIYSTILPKSLRTSSATDHAFQPVTMTTAAPPVVSPQPLSSDSSSRHKGSHDLPKDTMKLRLQYLEGMVSRLEKEKRAMDDEFGRQRKKFMNQMMQSEGEMELMKNSLTRHVQQIDALNKLLAERDEDLKSFKNNVGGTTVNGQKYEAEIASLKQMIQTSAHEHQVEIEKMKADWSKEKKRLVELNAQEARKKLLEIDNKLSAAAAAGRRSKSPIKSPRSKSPLSELDDSPAVNFTSEASLENSMIKAAEDAKLLKSVIVPLEEEIDLLKMRLSEANERLQVYEKGNVESSLSHRLEGGVSPILGGVSVQDVTETEVLEKLLNQERAARHDLEMHIDGLRRQKVSLNEEIDSLKEQLTAGKRELEDEQKKYREMKETWQIANVNFISEKDKLSKELQEMKNNVNLHEKKRSDILGTYSPPPSQLPAAISRESPVQLEGVSRRRCISWSEGERSGNTDSDVLVWKPISEQLQRLLSEQHHELQNKNALIEMYEQQLERTQSQLMLEIDGKDNEIFKMREEVKKIKAALLRERKSRDDLKRMLASTKEDMKHQMDSFQTKENKLRQKHKEFKDKFTETRHDIQKQLASFTEERTRFYGMVDQKNEEYQCLKDLQANEKMIYEQKLVQTDNAKKEAEMNVAMTVEELTKVREQSIELETKLSGEVSDLKQLLSHIRHEKDKVEENLKLLQNETEEVKKINQQLEKERYDAILSRSNLQEKSKDFIENQQKQILQLNRQKDEYSNKVSDLQTQLSQLKQQLQNSESVQKDFVELSQSLQVKLVEIEEREELNKST